MQRNSWTRLKIGEAEERKKPKRGRERPERERLKKKKILNGSHVTFYIEASVREALCSLSPRRSPKGRRQTKSKLTTSCGDSAKRVSSLVTAYISSYFNICCRNERWRTHVFALYLHWLKWLIKDRDMESKFSTLFVMMVIWQIVCSDQPCWFLLHGIPTVTGLVCGCYCAFRYSTAVQCGWGVSYLTHQRACLKGILHLMN